MQRHLQKCFDAIHRLEFASSTKEDEFGEVIEIVLTTDIIAMVSPEGEVVPLGKGLRARGNVEDWLGRVEDAMFSTLRKRMKEGINDLQAKGREAFLPMHPSQVTDYRHFLNSYSCLFSTLFIINVSSWISNKLNTPLLILSR